jgi:UDP-glucose 4-epimerase
MILLFGKTGLVGSTLFLDADLQKRKLVAPTRQECDLTSELSVSRFLETLPRIDTVIHTAAITRDEEDSERALQINQSMTTQMLSVLRRLRPSKFIYFSSVDVYGRTLQRKPLVSESDALDPTSAYGSGKVEAESLLSKECAAKGILYYGLRTCGIYGKGDSKRKYNPTRLLEMARDKKKIRLFGDGKELREHLFVGDIARIVDELVSRDLPAGNYNATPGQPCSFLEISNYLIKRFPDAIVENSERSAPAHDISFDNRKLLQSLSSGFRFTTVFEGLERLK